MADYPKNKRTQGKFWQDMYDSYQITRTAQNTEAAAQAARAQAAYQAEQLRIQEKDLDRKKQEELLTKAYYEWVYQLQLASENSEIFDMANEILTAKELLDKHNVEEARGFINDLAFKKQVTDSYSALQSKIHKSLESPKLKEDAKNKASQISALFQNLESSLNKVQNALRITSDPDSIIKPYSDNAQDETKSLKETEEAPQVFVSFWSFLQKAVLPIIQLIALVVILVGLKNFFFYQSWGVTRPLLAIVFGLILFVCCSLLIVLDISGKKIFKHNIQKTLADMMHPVLLSDMKLLRKTMALAKQHKTIERALKASAAFNKQNIARDILISGISFLFLIAGLKFSADAIGFDSYGFATLSFLLMVLLPGWLVFQIFVVENKQRKNRQKRVDHWTNNKLRELQYLASQLESKIGQAYASLQDYAARNAILAYAGIATHSFAENVESSLLPLKELGYTELVSSARAPFDRIQVTHKVILNHLSKMEIIDEVANCLMVGLSEILPSSTIVLKARETRSSFDAFVAITKRVVQTGVVLREPVNKIIASYVSGDTDELKRSVNEMHTCFESINNVSHMAREATDETAILQVIAQKLMNVEWWVSINQQKYGPYDGTSMAMFIIEGKLDKETLCWTKGMDQWMPLRAAVEWLSKDGHD